MRAHPLGPVPCVVLAREGDPATALSVTILTVGLDADARPSVALAALLESRLAAKWPGASFVPSGDGFRIVGVVSESDASATATALRSALLTPASATELPFIQKKLEALAHRPLPIPASTLSEAKGAVAEVARCDGTPYSQANSAVVMIGQVEAWRHAAVGEGRLAFAIVGNERIAAIAANALAAGSPWPHAAPLESAVPQAPEGAVALVEASPGIAPGMARVTIAFREAHPAAAVAAAAALANPESALASRLSALGVAHSAAEIQDVTATVHPFGGCLSLTLDVAATRLSDDATGSAGKIAEVVALARQEVGLLLSGSKTAAIGKHEIGRAGDPREAAALAGWWALVGDDTPDHDRVAVVIRTPPSRDSASKNADPTNSAAANALKKALESATAALKTPIVEARVRVERGQDDLWVMLASPCGTIAERTFDSGVSATFVVAAASAGSTRVGSEVSLEPWFSPDGVGLVAHGPARAGEDPIAHARRIADAAARYFAAEPIDAATLSLTRGSLLAKADSLEARELGVLANAVYPDHPSWLDPRGTADALARSSNGAVLVRADDLRRGPMRVAVLANASAAQGSAAVEAADRWIARRSSGLRACGSPPASPAARVGTYAVEAAGRPSEAQLALRLPAGDANARLLASWWASILEGADGLLATAVGSTGLARSWNAKVMGPDHDGVLAIRIVSSESALDSAVAQTRALLDRIRSGALTSQELARAATRRSQADLTASLDPRARLVATWRGVSSSPAPPSINALRNFAASFFRDDALVIVAARPPRLEDASHEKTN
ncbi:MAG: hypothetical protein ABI461_09790 [Polyangiaceae bacterium]